MNKNLVTLLAVAAMLLLGCFRLQANTWVKNKAFVKFDNDCNFEWSYDNAEAGLWLENDFPALAALCGKHHVLRIAPAFRLPEMAGVYVLEADSPIGMGLLLRELENLNYVAYAERMPDYRLFCTPNDPLFASQWSMASTDAENALNVLTGGTCDFDAIACNAEMVIAIVDDAVRITHEDLQPNIWVNPGEIAGNGIDDDGNGYVDDVNGWDAADNDNDPNPPLSLASNSCFTHGTHCAGIAAAATDNGLGVASLGFNNKIMAVKCTPDAAGCGAGIPAAFSGVEYAIAAGANVISMSWGGGGYSLTYQNLFDLANAQGIVCIAAAGNDAVNVPMYPASYDGVISVGATNDDDEITYFSNFGATIDVMAPGQDILSSLAGADNAYGQLSGTSMACPFVSGMAGLMLCFDNSLTPVEVEDCLESTATNIDAQNPDYVGQIGAGLVNVEQVLNCLQVPPVAEFSVDFEVYCPGEAIQMVNASTGPQISAYSWSFPGGVPASSSAAAPAVSYPSPGVYSITLTVTNPYGSHSVIHAVTVGTPTATLGGSTTIIGGGSVSLQVDYDGSLPYDLVYTEGTNQYTIAGVDENPFFFPVSPADTAVFELVSVTGDAGSCLADVSGQATVNVLHIGVGELCQYSSIYGTSDDNGFDRNSYYDTGEELLYRVGAWPHLCAIDARTGDVAWCRFYDDLPFVPFDVTVAPNGDLVMVSANTWGSSTDWLVYRADASGNLLWARQYQSVGRQGFTRIVRSSGDTYFVYGWFNTTGGSSDNVGIMKIDAAGNIINAIEVALAGDDQVGNAISDGAGGIVIAGEVEHDRTLFLLHFNANLGFVQSTQYHPIWDYYLTGDFRIINTLDGGYAITSWRNGGGEVDRYTTLLKIDAALNVEWARSFYPSGVSDIFARPFSLIQDADGAYYVGGIAGINPSFDSPFFIKIDVAGNHVWTKTQQDAATFDLETATLTYLAYNAGTPGYEVVAGTNFNGVFGGADFSVVRTDTDFSSCIFFDTDFEFQNETWERLNLGQSSQIANFNPINLGTTSSDFVLNRTVPCIECEPDSCGLACDFALAADTICAGESVSLLPDCVGLPHYIWHVNDTLFSNDFSPTLTLGQAGDYTIKLYANNDTCTALAEHELTVAGSAAGTDGDVVICLGDSTTLNAYGGVAYQWSPATGLDDPNSPNPVAQPDVSTEYHVTITDPVGCDIVDSLTVWVAPLPVLLPVQIDTFACTNDTLVIEISELTPISDYTYSWVPATGLSCTDCPNPTATVWESIVYTLNITNGQGCTNQQTFTIGLESVEGNLTELDIDICEGSTYFAQGGFQSTSGTYYDTLASVAGCDSVIVTVLAVGPNIVSELEVEICEGEGHFAQGALQSTSGMYYDTLAAAAGCDSIVATNLTVAAAFESNNQVTICEGESHFAGGFAQTQSGVYYDSLSSVAGCDSIIITQLTVEDCTPCKVLFPNAFSPNGDGLNDEFGAYPTCPIRNYSLAIYNRWGEKLFATQSELERWNGTYKGKDVELGVYVWHVSYEIYDNDTYQRQSQQGNVSLLR